MNINFPMWIWILLIAFILLLLILIIYLVYKSKIKSRLKKLMVDIDNSRDKIDQKKINKKFSELKKYKVTNTLNNHINEYITPKIEEHSLNYGKLEVEYSESRNSFFNEKVFKLENKLKSLKKDYKKLNVNIDKISKEINQIFEEEKQNREIVDLLSLKLKAFNTSYLQYEDIFYYPVLREKFNILYEKYTTIETSNDNEYDYLVETSKEVYTKIKDLEDKVISYPDIYNRSNEEFKRLGEVNELYEKLVLQKYDLSELDFSNKFSIVSLGIEQLLENLTNLESIDETILDRCSNFIEDAYLRFEDEISSKENINRLLSTYEENVADLENIYSQFIHESNHIVKYEISDEVLNKITEFKNSIKIYLDRYYNISDTLSDSSVEYSWANSELVEINDNILKYKEESFNYVSKFRQIRKDEINAIEELHKLNNVLNETIFDALSNKIEIDTNYSSQTTCRVILKRLATQLQAPKINIENVNELLTQSISIISDYKINITKQIKMKKISKKTYIYANRYRINIEDKIALNMSSKLISQGMYKKAIENIYKVINKNESIKDITLFIKIWEERI